jgi:uncharacterized membrane protein YecN with MAPEG domain
VHANFAEYVPFALVLLGLAESLHAPLALLHALGIALLAGRLTHAYGVSRQNEQYRFRIAGMTLTLVVLGLAALTCLAEAVMQRF